MITVNAHLTTTKKPQEYARDVDEKPMALNANVTSTEPISSIFTSYSALWILYRFAINIYAIKSQVRWSSVFPSSTPKWQSTQVESSSGIRTQNWSAGIDEKHWQYPYTVCFGRASWLRNGWGIAQSYVRRACNLVYHTLCNPRIGNPRIWPDRGGF